MNRRQFIIILSGMAIAVESPAIASSPVSIKMLDEDGDCFYVRRFCSDTCMRSFTPTEEDLLYMFNVEMNPIGDCSSYWQCDACGVEMNVDAIEKLPDGFKQFLEVGNSSGWV